MDFLANILDKILINKELIWPVKIFAIIFIAMVLSFFFTKIINKLEKKLAKNQKEWDDVVIVAIRRPFKSLIWILGIAFAIDISNQYSKTDFSYISITIKNLGLILALGWSCWRIIKSYEQKLIKDKKTKKLDITTASAVIKLIKASLVRYLCNLPLGVNRILSNPPS